MAKDVEGDIDIAALVLLTVSPCCCCAAVLDAVVAVVPILEVSILGRAS
jgi:hypothetical protein